MLRRTRQLGLSLVELMIALTLGAVVSVGVIQLFSANSDTYDLMQGQSRMQESARFALNFISRSVQSAGFKGCFSTTSEVGTTLTSTSNIPYEFYLNDGMVGYDGQSTGWLPGSYSTDLGTPFVTGNGIPLASILGKTDILTVRSASQNQLPLVTDMANNSDPVEAKVPSSGLEFAVNDLAIIADCEQSTIFRITSLTMNSPSAGDVTIGHGTGDIDSTRNDDPMLTHVNSYTKADAAVSAIQTSTFYVAPGDGYNNVGDHPYSLWRKFGTAAPVELVEGVEDLQFLYGVDTDADGTPNEYVTGNLVPLNDFSQVVTV
ncbi:MAG TPA: PilW family protein, partial [Pseudomonadales bacterium]|nr:PilW family protein [Pseudomonadales bacterium]